MLVISPEDLVPLNAFTAQFPISIHLAYADRAYEYNLFKGLYHDGAKIMWAHKDFAPVILIASLLCQKRHGWTLELFDCLRPTEAQEAMATKGFDPALVAGPGIGGHPRAMAIDIWPRDKTGALVEMGTPFDFFAETPATYNPAARNHTEFDCSESECQVILKNRAALETAMVEAGCVIGKEVLPLPHEWWDFRFMPEYFNLFAPLSEGNLEPYQRLLTPDIAAMNGILHGEYPLVMGELIANIARDVKKTFLSL